MRSIVVVGSILCVSAVFLQCEAAPPQMPAHGAVVELPADPPRQFDFWLGEWNVLNKQLGKAGWGDTGTARALIQPVAQGGAVLEQWTGALNDNPLIGFSLRAFDPGLGKWVIWLNWHGGRPGGFNPMHGVVKSDGGDRIELFPPNDTGSMRYTFSQPREGSCQWDEARSADGGATWTTRWIMQFTRADEPLAVDATNAPIVMPPESAAAFPETRSLDFLIGAWSGPARVRDDAAGPWRDVAARARVTTMIEGFGLLQYVDSDDGVKTMAALGSDARAKAWVALDVSPERPGIRYLTGQPAERAVTFTAYGDTPDYRAGWSCAGDDACTYRRETSADGGKTWNAVFEATLERAASTAAFVDLPRARAPFADVLTGGQPTREQLEWAARNGYRTIVNLRAPGEDGEIKDEAEFVQGLGMRYVHIPVGSGAALDLANAQRLAESIAGADALPAIVHCQSGNRVGALFAVKAREIDGMPSDRALDIGRAAGMSSLETVLRERYAAE